jgi:hypothetical protein
VKRTNTSQPRESGEGEEEERRRKKNLRQCVGVHNDHLPEVHCPGQNHLRVLIEALRGPGEKLGGKTQNKRKQERKKAD